MDKNSLDAKSAKKLIVYNTEGGKIEEVDSIFDERVNLKVLSCAVKMYLANERAGLAATKTRGEISGGGKKPWRQKGTGRARAGSIRSPLWRHGGVVFGPHPRSFHYHLSAATRQLALLSALNEKAGEQNIIILDKLAIADIKTKEMVRLLSKLKPAFLGPESPLLKRARKIEKITLVLARPSQEICLASRNIPGFSLVWAFNMNALDVLKAQRIILLWDTLPILTERLSRITKKNLPLAETQMIPVRNFISNGVSARIKDTDGHR